MQGFGAQKTNGLSAFKVRAFDVGVFQIERGYGALQGLL